MRSYHKHKGSVGSHKISVIHKDKSARTWHDKEIEAYEKNNKISNKKPTKKSFTKTASNFLEVLSGKKKENSITFPIDENGTIIADMTKLKNSIYVKFVSIVDWESRRQEKVEIKIKSLPNAKGISKSKWKQSDLFK